ncbi:hypothetical protein [Tepidibacter aestuarii]|uniref:hypothetical protein n=1 Tax=Tepidibacter aestuarii TaxID=2925782 RepID=UPI0020BE539A|nr:hypothetical protein [Tepidibacter aestuarii]CAH2213794.1 protein of unknown function [Tepidibacter aestuarii]
MKIFQNSIIANELELDENGWVYIDQLIKSLRSDRKWESLNIKDLKIMVEK